MTLLTQATSDGQRWCLRPALRERSDELLGPAGLRLEEWLQDGRATVLKKAPHRTIYRVLLPDLDLFVKHYPLQDARSWLRGLFRPAKARGEYDRALAVAARGVPTIEPLALGEALTRPGASYFVTRTLTEVTPLNVYLERTFKTLHEDEQVRFRQALAVALGRLLAVMHDGGVTHLDLHPGNLLLRRGQAGEPLLTLIDLHAVRLGRPLSEGARRANLALLDRWFMMRAERTDRLRCWQAYEAARGGSARRTSPGKAAAAVLASNEALWRQRERRCLEGNRYFRPVALSGVQGHVVADFDADLVMRFLADPDAPFSWPGARILKHSASSTVAELAVSWGGEVRQLIYKRFAATAWSDPLAALVRPTAALRSFVLGHGLRARGLPTPRPLGVWQRRTCGLTGTGYLLAEKVPEAVDLGAHITGLAAQTDGRARIVALRDQVARLVGLLHERGLSHRDLKAPNLLVSPAPWSASLPERPEAAPPTAAGSTPNQIWFIDLVGLARLGKVGRTRRVRDLTRLAVSFLGHPAITNGDRLRFLLIYLRAGLGGSVDWKGWWREIAQGVTAKVARNLKRGRVLG